MKIASTTVGALLMWGLTNEFLFYSFRKADGLGQITFLIIISLAPSILFIFLRIKSFRKLPSINKFWPALGIAFYPQS